MGWPERIEVVSRRLLAMTGLCLAFTVGGVLGWLRYGEWNEE